jgi:hypothetical protein
MIKARLEPPSSVESELNRASSFQQCFEAAQNSRPAVADARANFAAGRQFVMGCDLKWVRQWSGFFGHPGGMTRK